MIRQKIALFASGRGTNALNIIKHFKNHPTIEVALLVCNKADAPIVEEVNKLGIECIICKNSDIEVPGFLVGICRDRGIDFIVLAGFLRKIPIDFVTHFENKIINIHPALLPKFGGEGMYGKFVHQAVLEAGENTTGISIHFVNSEYDKGEIIAQFSCELTENESVESIQEKIHCLEMEHFPPVIEKTLSQKR